jgi:exonuclease III
VGTDVEYNIIDEFKDTLENYYVCDMIIRGTRYGIGSIYGPNNTSREFYRNLSKIIQRLKDSGNNNIIMGGDWNTTWDRRPVTSNIDTFCMAGLPNPRNGEFLSNMCEMYELSDPYRALYPTRKEYTYLPFGAVRLNRSRIDFFIVSNNLLNVVTDCVVADSVSNKLFDHKQVSLTLYKQTAPIVKNNNTLSN